MQRFTPPLLAVQTIVASDAARSVDETARMDIPVREAMHGDLEDRATRRHLSQRFDQDICAKGFAQESDGAKFHRPHLD